MTSKPHTHRALLLAVLVVLSAAVAGVAATGTSNGASTSTASVNEAVEYDGTIELALDADTGSPIQAGNVDVWVDGEARSVSVAEDGTDGRVVLTGLSDVGPTHSLVVDVDQSGDLSTGNVSVTVTGSVLEANHNGNFFPGATIAYVASAEDVTIDIYSDGDYVVRRSTGQNSKIYVIDTSDQSVGPTYEVREVDGAQVDTKYNLRDLGLTAEANTSVISESGSVEVTVTSNGANRPAEFRLVDVDSDDVVETVEARMGGNGEASATFSGPSSGTYEVVVVDTITGITASTGQISVGSTSSGAVTLSKGVYGDQAGDVVEVVLNYGGETAGTTAGVTLGSSDAGFQVEFGVTDDDGDGRAVVHWSTADGANASGGVWVSGGSLDGSVSVVDSLSEPPETGEYPVTVKTGGRETDIATILVQSRETSGVSVLTAPGTRASWSDLAELRSAASRDGTVAVDTLSLEHDWVIVQIDATGLEGYVSDIADVDGANGLTLSIVESEETVGQNDDPITFDVAGGTLFAAGSEDTYYVALKTEHRASGVEPGDEFEVTFSVDANGNPVTSSNEEVTTTFTLVNGSAKVGTDDGIITVPSEAGATIAGTSTFAPGTELSVVARREGGQSPFVKYDRDVVVGADGSWTAEFDFSDVPDGTEFTVRVKKEDATRVTADGRVGSNGNSGSGDGSETTPTATAGSDETPTATDTPDPDVTETDADEGSTPTSGGADDDGGDDEGTTPTGAETPGFGVVVALLAVLATALLRREN